MKLERGGISHQIWELARNSSLWAAGTPLALHKTLLGRAWPSGCWREPPRFRTIQVRPYDSPVALWQAESAGNPSGEEVPMLGIGRREFITLLGGAAAAWPVAARAQQPAKLPIVGFLGATTPSAQKKWTDAFVQRLRELGWIEGRTIAIEYRWAEGRNERAPEIFAEFVRLKVDVIVTHPTALAVVAKQATSLIPIVFALAGDPVGSGLVTSLARPGGNVTGLSLQMPDALTKRVELLREVVPGLRRLTILVNVGNQIAVQEMRSVQDVAGLSA
jgi:hypothetical protein